MVNVTLKPSDAHAANSSTAHNEGDADEELESQPNGGD